MESKKPNSHRSPLSAAKLIALCTLASRVTGLLRDILLLRAFGQGWVADAFNFAFQFPNLFRRLFGEGALAAVFVPAFTRSLESEGREAAWKLLARTFALLTVTLVVLIIAIEIVLLGIWLLAPGSPAIPPAPHDASGAEIVPVAVVRAAYLGLTALMLPFMLSICVLALFSSILNCVGSFVPAALAPIVLNLFMIAGIVWVAPAVGSQSPQARVYVVALTVLVAGVAQLLVVLPALRQHGVKMGWSLDWRDESVRQILKLMGPVLLGQGVLLISTFLDTILCTLLTAKAAWLGPSFPYPLRDGALTAISNAARLYQFPLGVLVISLATAALPAFSRLVVKQDWLGWAGEVRTMLRLAVFEGLLAGAMMIALAEPIVRLLFERGEFKPEDTTRAAHVLAWYGVGMWAFCAQHIVLRGFYSTGDVKTPLRITSWFVPVNLTISLTLVWVPALREAAFAISSSVTASLGVVIGLRALRTRSAVPLVDAKLLAGLAAMTLIAVVAAAGVWWLRGMWIGWLMATGWPGLVIRALDALGGIGLGGAVFLGCAYAARLPEVAMLLGVGRRGASRAWP